MTDLSLPPVDAVLLAEARRLLLEPAGLDTADLARILASIHTHEVDFADLYFQYSRMESWSLEEGIVKSGAFSIDGGVGIRAVHGEKQAFAYSDDITLGRARGGRRRDPRHRPPGPVRRRAAGADRQRPVALRAAGSGDLAARGGEGRPARAPREDGPGARSAGDAGDGLDRRRIRGGAGRAQRRADRRRRPAAGARVADGHRRGGRPPRAGPRRRRRALRLRVLHRRRARPLRRARGAPGHAQPRRPGDARRHDDRGPGARLAGHPAARGDRPRARGRLQPQGHERILGAGRAARRGRRASP